MFFKALATAVLKDASYSLPSQGKHQSVIRKLISLSLFCTISSNFTMFDFCKNKACVKSGTHNRHNPNLVTSKYILSTYLVLDVLWGQPIKLIQVVSTSEFHEY